ncbi:MAG: CHAT domain-containing protein [Lewinella sp.]
MQPRWRLPKAIILFAVVTVGTLAAQDIPIEALIAKGEHQLAETRLAATRDRDELYRAGMAWQAKGNTDKTIEYLKRATEDSEGVPIVDSLTGLAYHKMGVAAYYAEEDSLAAVYYRQAIKVRDRIFPPSHHDRAHSRTNLAAVMNWLGRPDTAIVLLREANTVYENSPAPDTLNWLRNLNELGKFAKASRNYRLGYSSSLRAVSLLEDMQVDDYDALHTYYLAADMLLRLNELSPALENAEKALKCAVELGREPELAEAYNMLAIVQREMNQLAASHQNLLRAERYALPTENSLMLGIIYLNLAEYYGGEGNRAEMEAYNRLAYQHLEAGDGLKYYYGSEKVPAILLGWGDAEAALGLLNERLAYLTNGRIDSLPLDSVDFLAAEIVPVIDMLGHRAAAFTQLDQPDRALADYQRLFQLQDRLRQQVQDSESRGFLSQDSRRFYDRAIALLLDQYREEQHEEDLWEAFRLSERARAYSLLASMQRDFNRIPSAVRNLQEDISKMEREVSLGADGRSEELAAARIKMDRLQAPDQAPVPPDFSIDRDELFSFLQTQNGHLLQYHLSPEGSVVFLLGPDGGIQVESIPADTTLNERVEQWRIAIEASSYRRKSMAGQDRQIQLDRAYLEGGMELAEQLLPTIFREALNLRAGAPRPRLCIVPDGVLNYLPFAALPLGEASLPLDYKQLPYLHAAADITHAYSAAYLLQVSKPADREYAQEVVAFAPSFSGTDGDQIAHRGARNLLRSNASLTPLLHSKDEVEAIAKLVERSLTYFDREADRAQFLASVGAGRILHISSHGSVDALDPNLSFVAFSQTGDSLQKEELLYFNDLYGLPIDNELTVLSACETALGKLAIGETTMSLASAFAAAGARSTLTTLWQVDDAATKDLVVEFYRRLVKGESRLEALNAAQKDVRDLGEYAHPYYWSALTLYGASGPVWSPEADDQLPWWAWLIIGLLVCATLGLFLAVIRRADANLTPGS